MSLGPYTLRPSAWLALFMAVAACCLWAWDHIGPLYQGTLLPPVNLLLERSDQPLVLRQYRELLLLAVPKVSGALHFMRLAPQDSTVLYSLAALALLATSRPPVFGRRLLSVAALFGALWLLQVASLYAGTLVAYSDYVYQHPEQTANLVQHAPLGPDACRLLGYIAGLGASWGPAALLLGFGFCTTAYAPYGPTPEARRA